MSSSAWTTSKRALMVIDVTVIACAVAATIVSGVLAAAGMWWIPAAVIVGCVAWFGAACAAWTGRAWALPVLLGVVATLAAAPLPLQQLVFLGITVVLAGRYGVRWVALLPIIPYGAFFFLTMLSPGDAGVAPLQQTLRSFSTFVGPWLLLSVRWSHVAARWRERVLLTLTWLPLLSVAVGFGLQLGGLGGAFAPTAEGLGRLKGAMANAPELAFLCVIATMASLYLLLSRRSRGMTVLALVNIGLCAATVTRGGLIATAIVFAGFACATFLRPAGRLRAHALSRTLVMSTAIVPLALLVWPLVTARSSAAGTSGRLEAWSTYLNYLAVNPIWGLGVGAADSIIIREDAFEAPHNEYLRFALDMGWLGAAFMLLAIVVTYVSLFLAAGRLERFFAVGCFFALAVYAITDNVFSTPAFTLSFALFIGVLVSFGGASAARTAHDGEPSLVDGQGPRPLGDRVGAGPPEAGQRSRFTTNPRIHDRRRGLAQRTVGRLSVDP